MSYSINALLGLMVEADASDLFVTLGAYPMLSIKGGTLPLEKEILTPEIIKELKDQLFVTEDRKSVV